MKIKGCLLVALGLVFIVAEQGFSLPAYKRLFKGKYRWTPSCALCHSQGGGSSLNGFGKDFKRAGMSINSFSRIEGNDSDKDGSANLAEIEARANPGDSGSRPDNPGDWLARTGKAYIPRDELKLFFPQADYWTVVEGRFKPEQAKRIEQALGRRIEDAEKVPVFYFAFSKKDDEARRLGLVIFRFLKYKDEYFKLGVAIGLDGVVKKVLALSEAELFGRGDLQGLAGRTSAQIGKEVALGKDKGLSRLTTQAVDWALLAMFEAFARR
ncbi:MAG: hypothetical protein ACE5GG_05675 [Candidatus Omnitrophota bacterium]